MPPPEVKKPAQAAQDEPAKPEGQNVPLRPATPQAAPQGFRKTEAPEPVKGEDGRPVIQPVTVTQSSIPHEDDGDPEDDEPRPDETVPGGRYQVGDKIVNANGEVLGDAPKPKPAKK